MIRYIKGDLLASEAEALVNTVNTVGVMGKGIALQFKERFANNFKFYKDACKNKELYPGKLIAFTEHTVEGDKIIINFPTKTDWRRKSSYQYIEDGLHNLVQLISERGIKSVALPPLGCGNGGLSWPKVKLLIEDILKDVSAEIIVYEPNEAIKKVLQKENTPKEARLTPARAMLLYSLFKFQSEGDDINVFVANKLAYFLQRLGENLRLTFQPHFYGPYSNKVEHVLYALNGKYIHGLEQHTAKPFESLILNYELLVEIRDFIEKELNAEQKNRLDNLFKLIQGFESGLSIEVLSSVDYIIADDPSIDKKGILERIENWSQRKAKLITRKHIDIAYSHLQAYKNLAL